MHVEGAVWCKVDFDLNDKINHNKIKSSNRQQDIASQSKLAISCSSTTVIELKLLIDLECVSETGMEYVVHSNQ